MHKTYNGKIQNLLIIRLSSIGDIILTTEFVRILRDKYPNARIDFLTNINFSELLKFNPNISNVIEYDKNKSSNEIISDRNHYLINHKIEKYDYIFDLHNNRRTTQWSKGIANKIFKIEKWRIEKLKMVWLKNRKITLPQIPINYLNSTSDLNLISDQQGLEIFLENEKEIISNSTKNNIIGIAPGANHFTKRYPSKKFAELVKLLFIEYPQIQILVFGDKNDQESAKKIIEANINQNIVDYTGKASLLETASNISKCDIFITNDTGLMHLASARKIPVCAIFGSTVKNLGFTPYGVKNEIIETELSLSCRPCSHIGKNKCPKGHFKCMETITPINVLNTLRKLI
ncbi:glycosyltransferase family 9 protein [Candidatus Kapabacteria bacterium]|nr:glycosyltransferase family 9 protein [Candidatus Kapabacteria bacterium]